MELAKEIYKITGKFPKSETYGLSSQMQRSAVAIASNIAEGYKRSHRQEYIQFLSIANGSAAELETQLLLARDLYKDLKVDFQKSLIIVDEILRMLYALIDKLKKNKTAT